MVAGVYLHDPTTVIAAVNPSLLTYTEGVVRVQTVGITRGLTVFDNTKKRSVQSLSVEYSIWLAPKRDKIHYGVLNAERVCRYAEVTAWSGKPTVKVAVTVDAPAVVKLMMQRLTTDD
jgi:inosine-uridine nucleoside N-ribohydrolase